MMHTSICLLLAHFIVRSRAAHGNSPPPLGKHYRSQNLAWGPCVVDIYGRSTCSSGYGMRFNTALCSIDRVPANEMTWELFRERYDGKKPVIVTNSTVGWPANTKHSLEALQWDHEHRWSVCHNDCVMEDFIGRGLEIWSPDKEKRARTPPNGLRQLFVDNETVPVNHALLQIDSRAADLYDFINDDYIPHPWLQNFLQAVRQVGNDYIEQTVSKLARTHLNITGDALDLRRRTAITMWRMQRAQAMPHIYHIVSSEMSGSPWHTDPPKTSFWNTLIQGTKRWLAVSPQRRARMTVAMEEKPIREWFEDDYNRWSTNNKSNRVPERAPHVECVQHAGETIYIPKEWPHVAMALSHSTAISEQVVTPRNFRSYISFHQRNAIHDCQRYSIKIFDDVRVEEKLESPWFFNEFFRASTRSNPAAQHMGRVAAMQLLCVAARHASNAADVKGRYAQLPRSIAKFAQPLCKKFHDICREHVKLYAFGILNQWTQSKFRMRRGEFRSAIVHTVPSSGMPAQEFQPQPPPLCRAAEDVPQALDAAIDKLEAEQTFNLAVFDGTLCANASAWLTHDTASAVLGYHVLCVRPSELPSERGQTVMTSFPHGVTRGAVRSTMRAPTVAGLRVQVERLLGITRTDAKRRRNKRKHKWVHPPWGMFTVSGEPIKSLSMARGLVLVFEGGHFVYPGMSVGYRREVDIGSRRLMLETLSLRPLVFAVDHFHAESDHKLIRELAEPHLASRGTMTGEQMTFLASDTGTGMRKIRQAIAKLTLVPPTFQEEIQIIRRQPNPKQRDVQRDWWDYETFGNESDIVDMTRGFYANRVLTVLSFLNNNQSITGGDVAFPTCDAWALRVKPVQGRAIMFYNLLPDGSGDLSSEYTVCPFASDNMWMSRTWIWNVPRSQ